MQKHSGLLPLNYIICLCFSVLAHVGDKIRGIPICAVIHFVVVHYTYAVIKNHLIFSVDITKLSHDRVLKCFPTLHPMLYVSYQ